ncbi:ACP S-malonyltransferase [Desulfovibrio oxyclinae]|uniref:ACP S-malonyltransferase n=1 Tax=Desulfovibrio oxyclinae TaxID=63560 RepID=UPI00036243C0|nr:ACP S-malonyltransferase [Desulfovibrio oxyclinae]
MSSLAILFPGQGSQEKGMGRDAAEAVPEAMALWELAEKESGLPLRTIYWEDEDADMSDTRALQPALTVVNISLWLALKDKLTPACTAGHSLGEYASLAAAGVLSPEDAVRAVTLRGKLMAESGGAGHGMAAVLKTRIGDVEGIVERAVEQTGAELRIANYNSPAQFVISGEAEALEAAQGMIKEIKGRAVPLPVSGAFHSPLIQEAADEFARFLDTLQWNSPAFPVYHNATASTESDPEVIREIMKKQMTSSVLWIQTLDAMWGDGMREFAEIGPKGVLFKLLKPNFKDRDEPWEGRNIDSLDAVS